MVSCSWFDKYSMKTSVLISVGQISIFFHEKNYFFMTKTIATWFFHFCKCSQCLANNFDFCGPLTGSWGIPKGPQTTL